MALTEFPIPTTQVSAAVHTLMVAANQAAMKTAVGLGNADNTSDAAKPISIATQTALNLKAPLAAPHFTGNAQIDGQLFIKKTGSGDIILVDEFGVSIQKPLSELVREISDADSTSIDILDLIINYKRTDSAALVAPDPGESSLGQHLAITNTSAAAFDLNGSVVNSFYDGSSGVVSSLVIAADESITFISEEGPSSSVWRVISRYPSTGGGGSGDVVGPASAVSGNIAVFDGVTGKIIKDVGAVPLDGISVSSGTGSAGKVPLVGTDGFLSPTFYKVSPGTFEARLTTESGVPVSPADRTAQSTLYLTPSNGNQISLYSSGVWTPLRMAEVSIALSGLTSGKNYDVFVYDNSGTPALVLSAAWATDSTRTDALTRQDGVLVLASDNTRRLAGTIRTTGATTTEDSALNRFVWNVKNQAPRNLLKADANSHTYTTTTWRQWNDGSGGPFQVNFVVGEIQALIFGVVLASKKNAGGDGDDTVFSPTLNSTTSPGHTALQPASQSPGYLGGQDTDVCLLGYNYISFNEIGFGAGATAIGFTMTGLIWN